MSKWLFSSGIHEEERDWYRRNLQQGRTALFVRLEDASAGDRIESLLFEAGAIDVEEEGDISAEHAATADPIVKREYEVIEGREEPIKKTACVVEEVVAKKDATNRTETVKDEVRETKVEATKAPTPHRR